MTDHDNHVLAIADSKRQWQRIRSHALPRGPMRLVLPLADRKRDATGRRCVGLNLEHAYVCTADLLQCGWTRREIAERLDPPDHIVHNRSGRHLKTDGTKAATMRLYSLPRVMQAERARQ